jgi:tetratricopeptide (TPR) repeat protein/O-antigen ligase
MREIDTPIKLSRGYLGQLILNSLLIVSAGIVSLSPLTRAYLLYVWGAMAVGILSSGALWAWRVGHLPSFSFCPPRFTTYLALLCQIAAATAQAFVAVELPAPYFSSLNTTPGVKTLYLLLAGALAFATTWRADHRQSHYGWTALLAAGVFSSTLYVRAFTVLEAGPIYGAIFALVLIALCELRIAPAELRATLQRPAVLWMCIFITILGLITPFSPVPAQSWAYWFRLAALVGLTITLSLYISAQDRWRAAAWLMILIAGGLPVILTLGKLCSLVPLFGFLPALSHRFHPNEMGGANLIARSALCVAPLALALRPQTKSRILRFALGALPLGSLFLMIYTQSWEGFFALLFALGVYVALGRWEHLQSAWKAWPGIPVIKWGIVAGIFLLGFVGMLWLTLQVAPRLNVYSFNGRLIHWYGAVMAWLDQPWTGGGLGNEILYTPYADHIRLFKSTQVTQDNPLGVIPINAGLTLRTHSHNLFLEILAGAGIFGLVSFGGVLFALGRLGWRAWSNPGIPRRRVAGCIAGIVGALAWGMLDVLWVTPLFFSFPVWGIVGLLLALDRADGEKSLPEQEKGNPEHIHMVLTGLILIAALGGVLVPSLATSCYIRGFVRLQEQRWTEAALALKNAIRYAPLNAHYHQLLAEAYLGQDDTALAQSAYENALAHKQGYSPYLTQLGWLAWLSEGAAAAAPYFEAAIAQDPSEAWRDGLHANLGLAYIAQGHKEQALPLFKKTLELNPDMAQAPYWMRIRRPDGQFDVVLDPLYSQGPSIEMEKRIQHHLGVPNITERLFAFSPATDIELSLNTILDVMRDDYHSAVNTENSEAPLLLAAQAEAARLTGLYGRSEKLLLEFQTNWPDSAYGFRDLGLLYYAQRDYAQAEALLEQAITVSPNDFASRYSLAEVYLAQQKWREAEQTMRAIKRQELLKPFHSALFNPDFFALQVQLYHEQGETLQALQAQRKLALIRGNVANYLHLAALYRQVGDPAAAVAQCWQAADALRRTWPRPFDPQLWDLAVCFTSSDHSQFASSSPAPCPLPLASCHILLGHIHRVRDELPAALRAYEQAASARPESAAPLYFQGETNQALGDPDAAEAAYRRAAALSAVESLPHLALGRLQWARGQREEAVASFRAAVQTTPGWAEAHLALGNALLALDDRTGADQHYRQAQLVSRELREGVVYDFAVHLAAADITTPDPDYVRNDTFTIEGERQRVLFAHPPARVSYTLTLPASPLPAGGLALAFDVATAPESWHQPGDGVTFTVSILDPSTSNLQPLVSTAIDPQQDEDDRRWHPHTVDLSAYAGQTVTLVFETGVGPAGDERFDWAVWGEPRLVQP